MRRRILALGMASLLVVVSACSSGGSKDVHPIGTAPGPNPDVVPAVITPAYVDAVFKVLNHLDGDVSRSLVKGRTVTSRDLSILRAIYGDALYQEEVQIADQSAQQNVSGLRRPLGDRVTTVVSMIDAGPKCVFVATRTDYSQVLIHPAPPAAAEFWRLSPKSTSSEISDINPTPWVLTFNATYKTPTSIPDQCSGD